MDQERWTTLRHNSSVSIIAVNTSQEVSTSILQVTEENPGHYHFRCNASLSILGVNNSETLSDTIHVVGEWQLYYYGTGMWHTNSSLYTIFFAGPSNPQKPVNTYFSNPLATSVNIIWTVSFIAFTPENYTVYYSQGSDSLIRMSETKEGSTNFTDRNMLFSLEVSGLLPGTIYFYQVNVSNSYGWTLSDIHIFATSDKLMCKLFLILEFIHISIAIIEYHE